MSSLKRAVLRLLRTVAEQFSVRRFGNEKQPPRYDGHFSRFKSIRRSHFGSEKQIVEHVRSLRNGSE